MRVTSVELHPTNSSDVAIFSFRDPTGVNPYNVKSILGLDADEIVPKYYGSYGSSRQYYTLALQKREIVLLVNLNPNFSENETYSDLRDALYKMISSSRTGKLEVQFKDDTVVKAAVSGFVLKFEAPHFERTQEIQLTIKCDEPMLKAPTAISVPIAGLVPSNTLIEDTLSTAPHGFKFKMDINATIGSITITDPTDLTWSFVIDPLTDFLDNDVLYFSSEHNDKYLYIVRAGNTIQLADSISQGSLWPLIFPGENRFAFTNPTNISWNEITYYPTYWGI